MGVGQKTGFCLPLSSAPCLLCHWCHPSKTFKGQLVKESLSHASRETWLCFIRFSLGFPKLWSRGSSKGSSRKRLLKLQPPLQLGFKSILSSPGPAVVLDKIGRMHCSIKSSLEICSSFLLPVAFYRGSTADKDQWDRKCQSVSLVLFWRTLCGDVEEYSNLLSRRWISPIFLEPPTL